MSDSRPYSASSTTVGIFGIVGELYSSGIWRNWAVLNESRSSVILEPLLDQSFEFARVSGALSDCMGIDMTRAVPLLSFAAAAASDKR